MSVVHRGRATEGLQERTRFGRAANGTSDAMRKGNSYECIQRRCYLVAVSESAVLNSPAGEAIVLLSGALDSAGCSHLLGQEGRP